MLSGSRKYNKGMDLCYFILFEIENCHIKYKIQFLVFFNQESKVNQPSLGLTLRVTYIKKVFYYIQDIKNKIRNTIKKEKTLSSAMYD